LVFFLDFLFFLFFLLFFLFLLSLAAKLTKFFLTSLAGAAVLFGFGNGLTSAFGAASGVALTLRT